MAEYKKAQDIPDNDPIFVLCGEVGDVIVDKLSHRKPCQQKWCQDCPTLLWVTQEGLDQLKGKTTVFLCQECFVRKTAKEQEAGEEIIVVKNERRN